MIFILWGFLTNAVFIIFTDVLFADVQDVFASDNNVSRNSYLSGLPSATMLKSAHVAGIRKLLHPGYIFLGYMEGCH